MKHSCKEKKWWELIKMTDDRFCVAFGKNNICFAIEFFDKKPDAYKWKNMNLTKFKMICH